MISPTTGLAARIVGSLETNSLSLLAASSTPAAALDPLLAEELEGLRFASDAFHLIGGDRRGGVESRDGRGHVPVRQPRSGLVSVRGHQIR